MSLKYDDSVHHTRRILPISASSGISVPGTAASDTVLIRFRITDPITVDKASVVAMTGGTAAGPNLVLQKSLAGTGTAAGFATHNFGTAADNASAALTVASTDFAAGDHLLITNAAGTAASTPKANLMIGYVESFP